MHTIKLTAAEMAAMDAAAQLANVTREEWITGTIRAALAIGQKEEQSAPQASAMYGVYRDAIGEALADNRHVACTKRGAWFTAADMASALNLPPPIHLNYLGRALAHFADIGWLERKQRGAGGKKGSRYRKLTR